MQTIKQQTASALGLEPYLDQCAFKTHLLKQITHLFPYVTKLVLGLLPTWPSFCFLPLQPHQWSWYFCAVRGEECGRQQRIWRKGIYSTVIPWAFLHSHSPREKRMGGNIPKVHGNIAGIPLQELCMVRANTCLGAVSATVEQLCWHFTARATLHFSSASKTAGWGQDTLLRDLHKITFTRTQVTTLLFRVKQAKFWKMKEFRLPWLL